MQPEHAIAVTAFWIGVVATISLPLGALTSRYWVPEDRTLAALMAFGGGALLAALSIDLVAPALEHGHFSEIAVGAIGGGLAFVFLNEAVNDYGGFIRKVSTRVYHLRRKEHERYRKVLSRLEDLDIFGEVENRDFRAIAAFIEIRSYTANTHIFRQEDPSEGLYILASGATSLLDPMQDMKVVRQIRPWETFAQQAFLTGAPHDTVSVTTQDSEIWLLPRERFLTLLVSSPRLAQAIHSWLRSAKTVDYLVQRQGMAVEDANAWLDSAVLDLIRHATVPPALEIGHNVSRFFAILPKLRRTELFIDLPASELEAVAQHLIYKRLRKGEAFFHAGDIADRLFIIDDGEVSLLDPTDQTRNREVLSDGYAFGVMAFISGSRHSAAAVASEDTSY